MIAEIKKKINKDIYETFKYLKLNQTATISTISLRFWFKYKVPL